MAAYRNEQRWVHHRGRTFHFVSYEGKPANAKRLEPATEPAWFLMQGGKRWEAMPYVEGQAETELDGQLAAWLDEHVFAGESPPPPPPAPTPPSVRRRKNVQK
jgi:hypothetical protein